MSITAEEIEELRRFKLRQDSTTIQSEEDYMGSIKSMREELLKMIKL